MIATRQTPEFVYQIIISDCHQEEVKIFWDISEKGYILIKHICTRCNQECNKGRVVCE